MKINEVEKKLNIPKATIRFYEKEGLLNPERKENSYREYNDSDIEILKKIIVFRKIGIPVEDIQLILNNHLSLQEALLKNTTSLKNQIKEIEGALKVSEMMIERNEDLSSFDEHYYWDIVHSEEEKGNKFFEILNDVIEFEKKIIGEEFVFIVDENGNFKYSLIKSILISFCMCICVGIIWYLMDRDPMSFVEGFFFPFACILVSTIFRLPIHFLGKKNKEVANKISKIGFRFAVILVACLFLMMFFIN